MKIENPNNLSIIQIVEKLTEAGFEIKQDKRIKSSYYYIIGKNKFTISYGLEGINFGIIPQNIKFLVVIIVLFGGVAVIFSWFVLHIISSGVIIAGVLVGTLIFALTYKMLNKKIYHNEIKKIHEIIT